MSIEFETDQQQIPRFVPEHKVSGITAFLINLGIIKDESQSKGILLAIMLINFIIAGAIIYFFVLK